MDRCLRTGSAAPRRLTSNKGSESGPAWSPDSARIAFAAKRDDDEVHQIYVLDVVRGGEAQRVTAAPTAASVPRWSPDGQTHLFQAAMWPGATDEESNRKAVQERKNIEVEGSHLRLVSNQKLRSLDRGLEEPPLGRRRRRRSQSAQPAWRVEGRRREPGYGGDGARRRLVARWPVGCFRRDREYGCWRRSAMVLGSHLWQVARSGGEPKRLDAGRSRLRRARASAPTERPLALTATRREGRDLSLIAYRLRPVADREGQPVSIRHNGSRSCRLVQLVVHARQPDAST